VPLIIDGFADRNPAVLLVPECRCGCKMRYFLQTDAGPPTRWVNRLLAKIEGLKTLSATGRARTELTCKGAQNVASAF